MDDVVGFTTGCVMLETGLACDLAFNCIKLDVQAEDVLSDVRRRSVGDL